MNPMQKAGGYATFGLGVQFAAILAIEFGVLIPLGIRGPDTPPATMLAVAATSPIPFLIVRLINALFGITLVVSALGVQARLQAGAPNRMRLAVIAAAVAGVLLLANGSIGFGSLPLIVAANDPTALRAVQAVTDGLRQAAIFASGWTWILQGWAGRATKELPAPLSYLLLLAGVLAILAFMIPVLFLLVAVVNVVWAFWLGVVLLTQPAPLAVHAEPTI